MHIDESGKIYAQLNSFMRSLVNSEALSQIFVNNSMRSLEKEIIYFTKVYFAKWDSQWYRARVKDMPDKDEVTVFLFDIGKTVTILRRDLFMNETNALHYIPPQVKINLHRVSLCRKDEIIDSCEFTHEKPGNTDLSASSRSIEIQRKARSEIPRTGIRH